jgi:hypothetical protein
MESMNINHATLDITFLSHPIAIRFVLLEMVFRFVQRCLIVAVF